MHYADVDIGWFWNLCMQNNKEDQQQNICLSAPVLTCITYMCCTDEKITLEHLVLHIHNNKYASKSDPSPVGEEGWKLIKLKLNKGRRKLQ